MRNKKRGTQFDSEEHLLSGAREQRPIGSDEAHDAVRNQPFVLSCGPAETPRQRKISVKSALAIECAVADAAARTECAPFRMKWISERDDHSTFDITSLAARRCSDPRAGTKLCDIEK